MYLDIDGKLYEVPAPLEAQMAAQLFQLIVDGLYPQIPTPIRQGLKLYARGELLKMEKALNKAGYDGTKIRPPTGEDSALHYMRIQFHQGLRGIHDAILLIDTEGGESNAITAFALSLPVADPGEGGRPLLTGGNERERQDVGDESAGPAPGDALPDAPALHL